MTLIEIIKQDLHQARCTRNPRQIALLSTLLGDFQRVDPTLETIADRQVIALVKKYKDDINKIQALTSVSAEALEVCEAELNIIAKYLPQQMTLDELQNAVDSIISKHTAVPTLGVVMTALAKNHGGKYDGKQAQLCVKSTLERYVIPISHSGGSEDTTN